MKALRGMVLIAALASATAGAEGQQQTLQGTPQLSAARWLAELMVANQWAIDASAIAQQRAKTEAVRNFAKHAGAHHTEVQAQLRQLARTQKIDIDAALEQAKGRPDEAVMHDGMVLSLRALERLDGENLDRAYLGSVLLSHDLAVEKLTWAMTQVQHRGLKRAVEEEVRALTLHRRLAYDLLGSKELAPPKARAQARRTPRR